MLEHLLKAYSRTVGGEHAYSRSAILSPSIFIRQLSRATKTATVYTIFRLIQLIEIYYANTSLRRPLLLHTVSHREISKVANKTF